MNLSRELINQISQSQNERNILEKSKKTYLSKCKVMTEILNEHVQSIREDALELNRDGSPVYHTGDAKRVIKLKLPMSPDIGMILFTLISIDPTLPKKRKRRGVEVEEEVEVVIDAATDPSEIGRNVATVSAQTFQNYKSALKWWHEFTCTSYDKQGVGWPEALDKAINLKINSYKKDIGIKKRNGIMKIEEGEKPYNLYGYMTICEYFMMMHPVNKKFNWHEGMFAGLFQKFSVHIIGRSDKIDDCTLSNIDWCNDALTIRFGTTKSDQSGEKTSDVKRVFYNPFRRTQY